MYLSNGSNKTERNRDDVDNGFSMEIFNQRVRLFSPISGAPKPSKKERDLAHWFVLYNCPEVQPYLEYVDYFKFAYTKLVNLILLLQTN